MNNQSNSDRVARQEACQYRPGQRVMLKQHPDIVDIVAEYDPQMVPPIWLVNDPKPRYPHELTRLTMPAFGIQQLASSSPRRSQPSRQKSPVGDRPKSPVGQ
jgi:hypothetical protein